MHAPAALLPGKNLLNLYESGRCGWLCSLFFIDQCVLACVPLRNIWPGFLSIHSGDKQWKAIHCYVASISKARVLLLAYKQQACVVTGCVSTYRRDQKSLLTYKAFVRNIPQTELLLLVINSKRSNMYVHLYRHVSDPF